MSFEREDDPFLSSKEILELKNNIELQKMVVKKNAIPQETGYALSVGNKTIRTKPEDLVEVPEEFKTYTLKMQSMEKKDDWFSITFRCKEIENYDVLKFAKASGKFEGNYIPQLECGEVATDFQI